MKLLWVLPRNRVTPEMLCLQKQGDLVLIWRDDIVEVYYPMTEEERHSQAA